MEYQIITNMCSQESHNFKHCVCRILVFSHGKSLWFNMETWISERPNRCRDSLKSVQLHTKLSKTKKKYLRSKSMKFYLIKVFSLWKYAKFGGNPEFFFFSIQNHNKISLEQFYVDLVQMSHPLEKFHSFSLKKRYFELYSLVHIPITVMYQSQQQLLGTSLLIWNYIYFT